MSSASIVLLTLISSLMITSSNGFQPKNVWQSLPTTTTTLSSSSRITSELSQIQQSRLLLGMPRGGSSDIVIDLLADDDDNDEDDEDDDDDDTTTTVPSRTSDESNQHLEDNETTLTSQVDTNADAAIETEVDIPENIIGKEDDNDDEDEDEDEDNDGVVEEDDEEEEKPTAAISSQPVSIVFKTNIGNPLIDTSLELLVSRSRTVENVKQTLSRMLPGRPPVDAMRLVSDGILLQDDQLINDAIDEEDDDEDDDNRTPSVTVVLDMVPPVDPKFGTQFHKIHDMTTSDLLDAYAANAAAMYHRSGVEQNLNGESSASEEAFLSFQLRQEAHSIREQLMQTFPEKAHALLSAEHPIVDTTEQRRGQRYRTSKGGARANLKRIIQTNLNIHWAATIRNSLLFLFFGLFGGRSAVSRNLLLLCAPMCFILQARAVKVYLKLAFYACAHPPSIILSLLPAPQQAILSFNPEESRRILYPEEFSKKPKKKKKIVVVEEDDDDDDDDDE